MCLNLLLLESIHVCFTERAEYQQLHKKREKEEGKKIKKLIEYE